jgi:hypothetical protein
LDIPPTASIADAVIFQDFVAISVHKDRQFRIYLVRIRDPDEVEHATRSFSVDGEITCLAICRSPEDGSVNLLAGIWLDGEPWLAQTRIDSNEDIEFNKINLLSSKMVSPSVQDWEVSDKLDYRNPIIRTRLGTSDNVDGDCCQYCLLGA